MKEINFDHNNIGGLAEIYAFPPNDLLRVRHDYRSGRHYVEMKTRDNIVSIPVYPDRSFVFDEQKSTADGGDYWQVSIEGVIPKLRYEVSQLIEVLERGEWLVLSQDHNGVVHLSGSVEVPLSFACEKTTGDSYTSLNGSSFTFSGSQPAPSLIIDMDDLNHI